LLFIDQQGNGYPCYGIWKAVTDGEIDLPHQDTLKKAYREGNFRALCRECVHGHPNDKWDIFPCSRYGCWVLPTIWGGLTKYPHIQFAGDQGKWCKNFHPDFDISLEQSRSRLERLLFDGDFWRDAFIEQKKPLDTFWPKTTKYEETNIIPVYSSKMGLYNIADDTPSSLDRFPPVNYFPHNPKDLDEISLSYLRERFLPICFLPHLRILFELAEEIHLLSIILTDPFSNTEFNYRSLFRDGTNAPSCFAEDSWKFLWRLPNSWPLWKLIVLNLSSAIRREKKYHGESIQDPQEYVISLRSMASHHHSYGKEEIDLSDVWQNNLGYWTNRADELRNIAKRYSQNTESLSSDLLAPIFLSSAKHADRSAAIQVWEAMDKHSSKKAFYLDDGNDGWLPCFSGSLADHHKAQFGCGLLNYLMWVRAIFGDSLGAIETFNSTNMSRKKPSQFVAYSAFPLDALKRARLKLTLAVLLQPIEGTYSIYSEMISEKAKLHLEKKEAEISAKKSSIRHYGHTMGHRISPLVNYFEQHDPTSEAAGCARMLDDMRLILQAHGVQSKEEFFNLNDGKKDDRFVDYHNSLDLLALLREKVALNCKMKVRVKLEDGKKEIFVRYPEFIFKISHAKVTPALFDTIKKRYCRLADAIFVEILSELVTNAVRHGWHAPSSKDASEANRAKVEIDVNTITIKGKNAIVLTNYYDNEEGLPPKPFFKTSWERWPDDTEHENSGPGMAISLFRAIGAGDLMVRIGSFPRPSEKQPGDLHVALLLEGLEKPLPQGGANR
jgi:hypothetical protein